MSKDLCGVREQAEALARERHPGGGSSMYKGSGGPTLAVEDSVMGLGSLVG